MRIGIVGAGFAGLAAAKVLDQFGHDVMVFEKCPDVGGVWSRTRRYPGLSTQNNKGTYALSDLPMPRDYPEWPSGEQVQAYLDSYADKFGLTGKIRTSTEITSAELDEHAPGWTLHWQAGDGSSGAEQVDHLVVANGIFSQPFVPQFPGKAAFEAAGGRVLAPSDVHDLDVVAGRDVLVVGYGKSACDVAVAVADASASTTVIARHLLWKMPKKIQGVLNFKYLMLTRLGESLFEYHTLRGVERVLHGPGKFVRNALLGSLGRVSRSQLHLDKHGLVPDGGFERIARSTVSLTTDGFFEKVDSGALAVIRDTTIEELVVGEDGKPAARLSNGDTIAADVVVCATGWHQGVPFLPEDVVDRITDEQGNFELYRFVLPHEVPALSFCGYNSSFFSPLSAEVAALWTASYLAGQHDVPDVDARKAQVTERLRWMQERTEGKHARGTNIIPFSLHNIDELLTEMGLSLPAATRFREWLLPIDPSDYSGLSEQLLHRVRQGRKDQPQDSSPVGAA